MNHLPVTGTAMGVLALIVALILRERAAMVTALVVTMASGISAWPVYETGHASYRQIRGIADDQGADWLDEHMDRADRTVWTFYAMAGLAAAAALAPIRPPREDPSHHH